MTTPNPTAAATDLPVIIVGAGPIGLAAAAHVLERGLTPLVIEASDQIAASIRAWGHTRLFSPWHYNIDDAARRLLETTSWLAPDPDTLPTGHDLINDYLTPLAEALGEHIRTGAQVVAISREGMDKTRSAHRAETPLLVRITTADGTEEDLDAQAVLDASGTWHQPNPLGRSGLPAPGEAAASDRGQITTPLPDVLGTDRNRFANRRVLVVGSGHSAANTLLDLAELATEAPATQLHWAIRAANPSRVYGGEAQDELAARGALGTRLRHLVEAGRITLHASTVITGFTPTETGLAVTTHTPAGIQELSVDIVVPATGFRPELAMLQELRLDLDAAVEAPRQLGPLIDAEFHSCGSVAPHGERVLAHPEPGFYIVGSKSYGRAPTLLLATGYEQVRSIAAALAGDRQAADDVHLNLPETGVCTTDLPGPSALTLLPVTATATDCCAS